MKETTKERSIFFDFPFEQQKVSSSSPGNHPGTITHVDDEDDDDADEGYQWHSLALSTINTTFLLMVLLFILFDRRQQKDDEELLNDYNSFRAVKE